MANKNFGDFKGILIIGLGLIGGSFGGSLKNEGYKGKIYGFDLKNERVKIAEEKNIIDQGFTDLESIPWDQIDLVVIASPVKTFLKVAESIKPFLKEGTIVTDVGSVKGDLVKQMKDILQPFRFVGGHPIAGTEKEGVENAVIGLFKNKRFIITDDNLDEAVEKIKNLWEDLGSKVEFMNPHDHDFIFASVSHLPHAVAFALVHSLIGLSDISKIDLFKYPGAGFKDFTRIAASSPEIWKDIFLENKDNLLKTIEEYQKALEVLKKLIENEDAEGLKKYIAESRDKRISLNE
jgi:prephenate dehydrogenase